MAQTHTQTPTGGRTRSETAVPSVGGLPHRWVPATALIGVLLAVAAGSGLLLDPYGGETDFARNAFRGTDLVSLFVVLPLLVGAAWALRRGSTRGHLLWLGALGYVAYQYAYVFAYSWNRLFLVYVALLSLAGFTLAAALIRIDPAGVAARFDDATPIRAAARFLTAVGVGLAVIELGQIVPTIFTGDVPKVVLDTGHPTSPVYVLDLGLVVPLLLLTAHWLRHRRPWGYVAAAIMLVKGATVGLSLLAANLVGVVAGGTTDGPLNVLWAAIAGGSAFVLVRFLRHVHDPEPERRPG